MDHDTIESLADSMLEHLTESRVVLVYAPNTIGKTRLAQHLKNRDPEGVVIYNAFVEDVFTWDNELVVLQMDLGSDLIRTIGTQGLDGAIVDNFRSFTHGKVEPTLDLNNGEIRFGAHSGDDSSKEGIKISRAEESIFVWCVYYSILAEAIDTLSDEPDLRSTSDYNGLTLAVIDDPVSSMDDVRIVAVALALAELVGRASKINLGFLITTHHALFFNVLFNSLRKKSKAFVLQRGATAGWSLKQQRNDSPFSYHLGIIEDINRAISENAIERTHFNQFRAILEKTSSFLGYTGGWGELLSGPDAVVMTRVLNLYSHDRFAELDSSEVSEEYRDALTSEFREFIKRFRWRIST